MRVLIYTRVSTAGQKEGYSLESQKVACAKRAAELGALEVTYLEDTYTGIELERPALQTLREMVLGGRVDAVIAFDPDRLSRNLADLLLITNELDRFNVDLIFVNFTWESTPLGRLFLELRGAIAEFEHALIKERTLRGKRQKASLGGLPGYVEPYGYLFDEKDDCLRIVKKEAAVLHYIYDEYNKGLSSGRSLVKKLNEQRIPAPKGGTWHASTLLRILSNRTYLGVLKVGGISIEVPAIITKKQFSMAQEVKEKNRRLSPRKTKAEYLLQNLLVCGLCGSKLKIAAHVVRGKNYSYYVCPLRRKKECTLNPCPTSKIDALVRQEFRRRFMLATPKFATFIHDKIKANLKEALEIKLSELGNIKNKERRLLDLALSGIIDHDLYREKQIDVEMNKKAIQEEVAKLEADNNRKQRIDLNIPKEFCAKTLGIFIEKVVVTNHNEVLVYASI